MQVPLQVSHLRNGTFWLFALFLFGYFFIMAAYYPFFPLWLHDINQLSKSDTGLVFGSRVMLISGVRGFGEGGVSC